MTPSPTTSNKVLILNFGSQVTQLIGRRVREVGVFCEIMPFNVSEERIREFNPRAVILSGGPASVRTAASPRAPQLVFELGVPVLGICYGQQTMVAQLGGEVLNGTTHEFGHTFLSFRNGNILLNDPTVWMSHGDQVVKLPPGFKTLAASSGAPHAMIADEARRFYGVQFHPEVTHTKGGAGLLKRFVVNIAGCKPDYSLTNEWARMLDSVRTQVGPEGKVIVALSGGVDSSVLALLVHDALGDRAICIHVDNGLMRKGESETVVRLFRESYNIPLDLVDARERFLGALKGVIEPEQKRKIIGKMFIDVFTEEARKFGDATFLAQGTLYPDVIESVSFDGSPTSTIKSHHNVGGLPKELGLTLVEPFRMLFKDEVRVLGRQQGLPEHFVDRHPFPGPGLGIRCPGAIEEWKLEMLRDADAIYIDELRKAGLYGKISQAFAVFDPTHTVGVQGDARVYGPVCVLRAFVTIDFMTGEAYEFDVAWLKKVMTRIINEVTGPQGQKFTRVLYDVTSKPPGTTEWE